MVATTFDNGIFALKGFTLDQTKGSMESGQQKGVLVTWTPPADHDPNVAMETNIKLMVRGDVSETYNIMLRAIVTTAERSPQEVNENEASKTADSSNDPKGSNGPARASPGKEAGGSADKPSVKGSESEQNLGQSGGENKSPAVGSLGATLVEETLGEVGSGVKVQVTDEK